MTHGIKISDEAWAEIDAAATRCGADVQDLLLGAVLTLTVGDAAVRQRAATRAVLTARVIRLRREGRKVAVVAAMTGLSTTQVSRILCRNGERTRNRTTTDRPGMANHQKETA